ncbi:MAG: hypothetical protein QW390_01135 [Candidatus Bathyarchaeia archaeon]
MKLKVLEERDNPLLGRREIRLEVDHGPAGTPGREETKREIAAHLGQDAQKIHIIRMATLTGTNRALCEVELYDSPEKARRVVPLHIQERGRPKPEKEGASPQTGPPGEDAEKRGKAGAKPGLGEGKR